MFYTNILVLYKEPRVNTKYKLCLWNWCIGKGWPEEAWTKCGYLENRDKKQNPRVATFKRFLRIDLSIKVDTSTQWKTFSILRSFSLIYAFSWSLSAEQTVEVPAVSSGEVLLTSLLSVSHRSQSHQSSQPQRTLLQHVAQSQTATQTSVVVKSIPASSTGAITHIMQQVGSFLFPAVYEQQ